MKKREIKIQAILELLLIIALVIVVNYLGTLAFYRLDFTKEKRYTLSNASKKLAAELDDQLYIKIYLDGDDLPAAYKNLRNAAREMIDEFRHVSNNKIDYEIFNPIEGLKGEELRNVLMDLRQNGIQAIDLYEKTDDGSRQKLLVPAAHFYYKGQQYAMYLADPSLGVNNPGTINKAIEGLEFNIANTLRRCVVKKARKVAFMDGHGELSEAQTKDATRLLQEFYTVERMNLNYDDSAFYMQHLDKVQNTPEDSLGFEIDRLTKEKLQSYDAIIFAKPRIAFADNEKYWIDQYIMHGGKVMWMIDPLNIESDTIARYGVTFSQDNDLNLMDLLFKYGVRINPDVVQDYNALVVPFAREGGGIEPRPWFYFPLLPSTNNHAINRNLDLVWMQYPASIDTVGSSKLKKTILLQGSASGKLSNHPVEISVRQVRKDPDPGFFNKSFIPMAVLVEGTFESPYKLVNKKLFDPFNTYKEQVENGKMIVVADGDLISNLIKKDGQIMPAGYDRLSQKVFGNRQFFMNCIDYLADDFGLIEVRNKDIQLRLLDKQKIDQPAEQKKWQLLNMALPIALVVIFGVLNNRIRKRKYERK